MPAARLALGTLGVRALATREATWQVASPTGSGERLDITARWWQSRPAGRRFELPVQSRHRRRHRADRRQRRPRVLRVGVGRRHPQRRRSPLRRRGPVGLGDGGSTVGCGSTSGSLGRWTGDARCRRRSRATRRDMRGRQAARRRVAGRRLRRRLAWRPLALVRATAPTICSLRNGDHGQPRCPAYPVGRRRYGSRPTTALTRSPAARRRRDHRRCVRPAACSRRCRVASPPRLARSSVAATGGLCRSGGRVPRGLPFEPAPWMQAWVCECASRARARCGLTTRAGLPMAGRPCRSGGNCRGRHGRDTTHACRRRLPLPLLTPDGPDTLAGSRPFSSQRCGSASATTACAPSSSST